MLQEVFDEVRLKELLQVAGEKIIVLHSNKTVSEFLVRIAPDDGEGWTDRSVQIGDIIFSTRCGVFEVTNINYFQSITTFDLRKLSDAS